jgi:hypothetical protein
MLLGEYCEDIDECADGKCRGDHKQCINTISNYEFSCREENKKNSTGYCVTLCVDVNCGHRVCKESVINRFWCHCDNGYSGENCITRANTKHL